MSKRNKSNLTVTAINGTKPILPYIARKIEEYALEKYGIKMIVRVKDDAEMKDEDTNNKTE